MSNNLNALRTEFLDRLSHSETCIAELEKYFIELKYNNSAAGSTITGISSEAEYSMLEHKLALLINNKDEEYMIAVGDFTDTSK